MGDAQPLRNALPRRFSANILLNLMRERRPDSGTLTLLLATTPTHEDASAPLCAESRNSLPGSEGQFRFWFWAILLTQVLLLALVGYRNRAVNDFDGTVYMRIAQYYATGNTGLMVSGFWGPLLSWLMVPSLWLGLSPFDAARIATAVSAVVFQLGCVSVLRSFGVPPVWRLFGMAISAVASVSWSVMWASPDLLVSGLMCLAISQLADSSWLTTPQTAFRAGLIGGAAYLAKAVAFPVMLAICAGFAILFAATRSATVGRVLKQLSITLCGLGLIAGPWILTLSLKYQKATFSESGPIALAIVGPPDTDRYHPIGRIMYRPEAGRITAWENPSAMPYARWSPFESGAYAAHELTHMVRNTWTIWRSLLDFDILSLGLLSALAGLLSLPKNWRQKLLKDKWRWALLPLVCSIGIYLPVFADASRYFCPAFPMFLVTIAGVCAWAGNRFPSYKRVIERAVFALVFVSFGIPALSRLPGAVRGDPGEQLTNVRLLARKLKDADAARALIGNPKDLAIDWVALLTEQPWYGQAPTPEACRESGAGLVLIDRGSIGARRFASHAGFENLDDLLFSSPAEAARFPVQVFKIRPP